jgi:cardiolipin synthase
LLELRGSLVRDLQGVFDADWSLATQGQSERRSNPQTAEYSSPPPFQPSVILPTGPDEKEHALEMVICDLLARSSQEVTLITPYFVPSLPVRIALQSAAKRNVRTRILLPDRSDQWVVDLASRLFATEMQRNGVEVYFHSREFLHAKLMMADRQVALIGSANMDERSFRLNWEVSALISSAAALEEMTTLVDELFRSSHPTAVSGKERGLIRKMGEGVVRILTPLL